MAIAHDADSVASASYVSGSSYSWSHTCSGSQRCLVVGVGAYQSGSAAAVSSVTYNGVALTPVKSLNQGGGAAYAWIGYLINPASGANTIAVTLTNSSTATNASAVSFTGVDQSTPVDSAGSSYSASGAPNPLLDVGVTTTRENDFIVDFISGIFHITSATPGASQVTVNNIVNNNYLTGQSYQGPVAVPGTFDDWTINTGGLSTYAVLVAFALAPAISANHFLATLGVGT